MSWQRYEKGEMAKHVIPDPPSAWNPDDILGWRLNEFRKMGFRGELLEFLGESHLDLRGVEKLIQAGADPVLAARIEAGHDFAGEDSRFDHELFDMIIASKTPIPDSPEDDSDWTERPPRRTVSGIL